MTLDTTADVKGDLAVSVSDHLVNNAEKGTVSYTVTGLDSDATATVTFSDRRDVQPRPTRRPSDDARHDGGRQGRPGGVGERPPGEQRGEGHGELHRDRSGQRRHGDGDVQRPPRRTTPPYAPPFG